MHKGVWHGENAEKQPKRILILGESHHWSSEDWVLGECETETQAEERRKKKAVEYMTERVVSNYLNCFSAGKYDSAYCFFDKIVKSFGFDPNDYRNEFWSKVYFGNYIPVLCGVKDKKAANQMKGEDKISKRSNRTLYNNALFHFVNTHGIDVIFCFSVLAYGNLPSMAVGQGEALDTCESLGTRGNKQVYLRHCLYKAGIERKDDQEHTSVKLEHDLEVYGIPHPSAPGGYDPEIFAKVLADKI